MSFPVVANFVKELHDVLPSAVHFKSSENKESGKKYINKVIPIWYTSCHYTDEQHAYF